MAKEKGQCQATGRFGRCLNRARKPGYPYCQKHAEAKGLQHPLVSTEGSRVLIGELKRAGWSNRTIARESGLAENTILGIAHNPTMHRRTAEKLLALRELEPEPFRVEVWPYRRRLQSLQAAGHTGRDIAKGTGLPTATVSFIVNGEGEWIGRRRAEVVDRYWREHAADPVGAPSIAAKRGGWPVPMWWDNIDDPREKPGITHCRECHGPQPFRSTGLCNTCRSRLWNAQNRDEVNRRRRERRRKAKEQTA